MKINIQLLLLSTILISACNHAKQEANGGINRKKETFLSKEIGWTVEIPEGFKSLSDNRVEVNAQKGKEAIEKASGETVQMTGLIHLINFQRNQFNSFTATIEPFSEARDGKYEKNNRLVKKLIFDTYVNQKIKIDTSSAKELVKKRSFNVFLVKIYGPNGDVIMNQLLYSQLIRGYDFGVIINYNNEADKKTLVDAFKNSEFE